MSYFNASTSGGFQRNIKVTSKAKDFVSRLQLLEFKLDKVDTPQTENSTNFLKESMKSVKEYFARIWGEESSLFPIHLSSLKKDIINTKEVVQKKEIIRHEVQHIRDYIKNKRGIYWDEVNSNDILYIYWHSKKELNIIEKIISCLDYLEAETTKLESQSLKKIA